MIRVYREQQGVDVSYLLVTLVLAPLAWRIFTDYKRGICWAVFLITALSANPVLISGGALPNFNLQRLILIVVLIAAVRTKRLLGPDRNVPFMGTLVVYAVVNLLPLIFSIDLLVSIKAYLGFTIEIVLFYIIISASFDSRKDARQVMVAGAAALVTVGILAIIERYSGLNPVDAFWPDYVRKPEYEFDTLSTFPHRILFGTAMAMGWPLALAFAQEGNRGRWIWWGCVCIVLLSCYLSFSRGPWVAAMFGGVLMFLFGGKMVRRQTMVVTFLFSIALLLRPGVWETISVSASETTDTDSFKGGTYQYRWELWAIAWDKISRSGIRLLFGFGPGTTEIMIFDAVLTYSGETTELWSWDNHYAATLIESGCAGLAAFAGLYGLFFLKIFRIRGAVDPQDKTLHAAIMAAITAMLFMMTNVAMFAPQLNYLLWALIAAGLRLGANDLREEPYDSAVA